MTKPAVGGRAVARPLLLAVTAACAALLCAAAAPAGAASPTPPDKTWNCRATVIFQTFGTVRVEPLVANGDPNGDDRALCATDDAGPTPISLGGLATTTGVATTRISTAAPAFQMPDSRATLENLDIGGLVKADTVNSSASGSCVNGKPNLTGGSQVLNPTVLGAPVNADPLLTIVGDTLNGLLGQTLTVKFNQQVRTATSLRQRAVEVELKDTSTGAVALSAVAGETKVSFTGDVCSATGAPPPPPIPIDPCPLGATYEPATNLCVILRHLPGGNSERIIVGKPFEGPSSGRVVALADLPASLRHTTCAKGKGPLFAILGTDGPDRITGTNRSDRILTLGGKDKASGGRLNDCIDGAAGGGTFTGDQGRDLVIGGKDRESIKGGADKDRLMGLGGNDRMTADFGADVVLAGSGADRVQLAVNGPAASADCGSGKDIVTLNRIEIKRVRNCESIRVTGVSKLR